MKRMWSKNELKEVVKGTQKDISTLVDSQGRERFIEGDITLTEISGLTQKYGKWSLSGSHLMLVVAFEVDNGVTIPAGNLYVVNLPEWIFDKIIPVYTGGSIEAKTVKLYSTTGYSSQDLGVTLQKSASAIQLYGASITTTDKRATRIVFDLLIDNE